MVWFIPTITTLLFSYLSGMFLFDVISAVAIALTVIVFAYMYFKGVDGHYLKEGIVVGVVWLIISVVLDIVLILVGVTKLTLFQYIIYVAPLYVIVPAITIGFGLYWEQINAD